jgi:hypothetical protein
MTKKKLQDEACLLHQPCIFHHQSPQDREERQRQQRLLDESRKKKEDKFEEYRDLFAKDFPKGMAAHYNFLTESIITDLERAI